jgi:hypothetical protein
LLHTVRKKVLGSFTLSSSITQEAINYREKRSRKKTLKVVLMKKCLEESFCVAGKSITDISNQETTNELFFRIENTKIGKRKKRKENVMKSMKEMSNFNDG